MDIEDLKAWNKSREFVSLIYRLTKDFPLEEKYNIVSQTRRAACSIAANIAEGFGRYHFKESKRFYSNARGSLYEVKSFLYISYDSEYIDKESLDYMLNKTLIITKLINGLIRATNKYSRDYSFKN